MKKFAMILITLLLAFGFTSVSFAHDGHQGDDHSEKVTYRDGVTTIVKTKHEVTHDKVVKREKSSEYVTEKKSEKSTYHEVDVKVTKEHHPQKDWYREVKTRTTFKVIKRVTWDEVTRYDTIKIFTTPVKITKTTVTTIKHYGKPGSGGKVFYKDTEVYRDKEFGKTQRRVVKETHVENKNYKTKYDRKVISVEISKGKWMKDDRRKGDRD